MLAEVTIAHESSRSNRLPFFTVVKAFTKIPSHNLSSLKSDELKPHKSARSLGVNTATRTIFHLGNEEKEVYKKAIRLAKPNRFT